jgi:glycosyltransferase involved in cell wall biosynthesis
MLPPPALLSSDLRHRFDAATATLRDNGRPNLLAIYHYLGGGTERHVHDLATLHRQRLNTWLLRPTTDGRLSLHGLQPTPTEEWIVDPATQWSLLLELLAACRIGRVHVHHLLGCETVLRRLLHGLGVPFDLTLHDYYLLAPNPFLLTEPSGFVGDAVSPPEAELLQAAWTQPPPTSLASWQREHGWLLEQAARIVAPSHDLAERYRRYVGVRPRVAAHPGTPRQYPPAQARRIDEREPLRVGFIGDLSRPKGVAVFLETARLAQARSSPVVFYVLGGILDADARAVQDSGVIHLGAYDEGALPSRLAALGLDLLWFPTQCAESFSYTLSEAMRAGLPLVAGDLGAFRERTAGRAWTWLVPWRASPTEWLQVLLDIRAQHLVPGIPPPIQPGQWDVDASFYEHDYLDWTGR